MKFAPTEHWFGLHPRTDADIIAAWGARTILRGPPHVQTVDVLLDRTSRFPETRELPIALQAWITGHVRPWLRNKCNRAYIDPASDDLLAASVITHDGQFIAEASPQRSRGYLYCVAWLEPAPAEDRDIAQHMEPSTCPNCGAEITHSIAMRGNTPPPKPGDVTACGACSALLIFTEDQRVRFPEDGELAIKLKGDPIMRDALLEAQRFVRTRSPAYKPTRDET